jgi:hypothetical protein
VQHLIPDILRPIECVPLMFSSSSQLSPILRSSYY